MALSKPPTDAQLKSVYKCISDFFRYRYQKHFSILIVGKFGTGKSSLINGLVGKPVAEEGRKKETGCTTETTKHSGVINGIELRVWDTPGLENVDSKDDSHLRDIAEKLNEDIDLMVYCLKMTDDRFYMDDKKAMKKLTEAFGKELWEHTVIALTFANRVQDPREGDEKLYFEEELGFWQEAIESFLKDELKIGPEIIQSLRILPTGYHTIKSRKPLNCAEWLPTFWMACFNASKDKGAINLAKINKRRLIFKGRKPSDGINEGGEDPTPPIGGYIPINEDQEQSIFERVWDILKPVLGVVANFVFGPFVHQMIRWLLG